MAQLNWNVPSIGGKAYNVGLYHGESTGHLVVYVNNKVTLIDFGVKDSKDYSFFLEQELFELTITKEGTGYKYALTHNEELDSPHNLQRRNAQRYDRMNLWVGGGILLLLLAILIAVFSLYGREQEASRVSLMNSGGVETIGRVLQADNKWYIQFVADDEAQRKRLPASDTIHPLGFPLATGDELILRYQPDNPGLLRVRWSEATATQLSHYKARTQLYHLSVNPNLAPSQAICQLELVYQQRGLAGWALFLHQQTDYNDTLNRNAYLRYIREPVVAERLQECL